MINKRVHGLNFIIIDDDEINAVVNKAPIVGAIRTVNNNGDGIFIDLGNGLYSYAPTQAETNADNVKLK